MATHWLSFVHLCLGFEFQSSNISFSVVNNFTLSLVKIQEQIIYAYILFLLLFLLCKGDRKQERENTTSQPRLYFISEEFRGGKTGPKSLWMCRQISHKLDSQNQIPSWEVVWEAAPS